MSNTDSLTKRGQVKQTAVLIVGFWLVFCLFRLLEGPSHAFLKGLLTLRSEYTVDEQLSKLYLFIIMLISVHSYTRLTESLKVKCSIGYLLLSLILYLSESNMITEETQPVFGLLVFVCPCVLLLRTRSWLSLSLLVVGFAVLGCGLLSDFAHDNKAMTLLPEDVLRSPYAAMEERFDVIGIAFLCLSAILCFRDPIVAFVVNNTIATMLVLLASGMITAGNSFLHYQYNPGGRLQVMALVLTMCGFVGFILLNKLMPSTPITLTVIKEDFFYLFLFSFFVVLPSIHGIARNTVALFVWLPFMSFLALYLWRSHQTCRAGRTRGGVKTVSATYPLLSGPGVRNRAAAEEMRGGGTSGQSNG